MFAMTGFVEVATIIKLRREQLGLTLAELEKRAGVTGATVSRIERCLVTPSPRVLQQIARGLDLDERDLLTQAGYLNEQTSGTRLTKFAEQIGGLRKKSSIKDLAKEFQSRYEELEVVEVPLLGSAPAGYFELLQEEYVQEYVPIPKVLIRTRNKVFALRVNGDSLIGDGIQDGDIVVLERNSPISDGKIYAIRVENEVVLRHLTRQGPKARLTSSNSDYKEMEIEELEILGRVILGGNWLPY